MIAWTPPGFQDNHGLTRYWYWRIQDRARVPTSAQDYSIDESDDSDTATIWNDALAK